MATLIVGCGTNQEIIDNGKPGQIKVIVFHDENRNGVMDQGELGLVDRVGIGQDISCPATNLDKVNRSDTNSSGEAEFSELNPGVYCVMYMGSRGSTTKLTVEISLSSEQNEVVAFGVTD